MQPDFYIILPLAGELVKFRENPKRKAPLPFQVAGPLRWSYRENPVLPV